MKRLFMGGPHIAKEPWKEQPRDKSSVEKWQSFGFADGTSLAKNSHVSRRCLQDIRHGIESNNSGQLARCN